MRLEAGSVELTRLGRGVRRSAATTSHTLHPNRSLGAGDLHPPRVPGPGAGRGLDRRHRPRFELEEGQGHILTFDLVHRVAGEGPHPRHRAQQPEKEVHGVDPLVDQGRAAVEGVGAPPGRAGVVLRRPVPLHLGRGQQGAAQGALVHRFLESQQGGLETALEDDAQPHVGLLGGGDQGVGARCRHVDGLLHEDVDPVRGRGQALLGVPSRGAADQDRGPGLLRRASPRGSRKAGRRARRPGPRSSRRCVPRSPRCRSPPRGPRGRAWR